MPSTCHAHFRLQFIEHLIVLVVMTLAFSFHCRECAHGRALLDVATAFLTLLLKMARSAKHCDRMLLHGTVGQRFRSVVHGFFTTSVINARTLIEHMISYPGGVGNNWICDGSFS